MIVSFFLHLYQPPQQHSYVFREIAEKCYLPLLKLLKNKKELKLTLNVPLSLLEWFEKEKYETFLADLKHFYLQGRIEVVGSGAYHPILTKIDQEEVARQVILNECGLAYYLGTNSNFEGEPMLMIKNIRGFFPPEMAFNRKLGETLSELNYEWVIVDEVSLREDGGVVPKLSGTDLLLVSRNRALSLCLACARDEDSTPFLEGVNYLAGNNQKALFLALDGETFGHHNKEGIYLLENVVDGLLRLGHSIETYSDAVSRLKTKKEVDVREATWGASDEDMAKGESYPKWYLKDNELHKAFQHLEELFFEELKKDPLKDSSKGASYESNLPIWNFNKLSLSEELTLEEKAYIKACVLYDKALNSDKYWWSSKNPDFDPNIIKRSLELFMKIFEKYEFKSEEFGNNVRKERDLILSLLKEG